MASFWWKKYLCRWVKDGAKWRGEGRQESSLGEGAGIGRDTRRAPRPCAVMGQSQGFVADAGRKGISAPS